MFYEPKKRNPFKIDPFKSLVFPRPIGWISSISKDGTSNLAPYSYFNAVADEPPQVMFCSIAFRVEFRCLLGNSKHPRNFLTKHENTVRESTRHPSERQLWKFVSLNNQSP